MNLTDLLNQSQYHFFFLVIDKFFDINLPQLQHFTSISSQKLNIKTKINNSGQLLSHPKTFKFISQSTSKKIAIIPFKPSAKISFHCRQHHWLPVCNPPHINRLLEDKIKFYQLCLSHHLPLIPSTITTLSPSSFQPKSVIQTRFGWAGKSTFIFDTYHQAIAKIPPQTPIKISPFLPGYTLTNNCCLTPQGLLQSPPALQLSGLKPYTTNPFATVGRQWPCLAPIEIQEQIKQITQNFSQQILQPINYRGFFGLDFLVSQNKIYLLECNPRLTASFAYYTHLELEHQIQPLFFHHLASFTHPDYQFNLPTEQQRFYSQISGSELTPKNKSGKIINQIHQPTPVIKSLK